MGNRAVVTIDNKTGIYLHWNGGRDSIEAFILYCKLRGFRCQGDNTYGIARLNQIISNFIGGDLSVGMGDINNLDCDNHDNGLYIIEDWKIIERQFFDGEEQNEYDIYEFLKSIDSQQPLKDRLFKGKKEINKSHVDKILKKNGSK